MKKGDIVQDVRDGRFYRFDHEFRSETVGHSFLVSDEENRYQYIPQGFIRLTIPKNNYLKLSILFLKTLKLLFRGYKQKMLERLNYPNL